MINARADTVAQKPSFRRPFQKTRCLVLADGFYEWRKVDGTRAKVPMRFVLKSREPFAFAGLWDIWIKPDGGEIRSFTIITTEPNDLMKRIHNRMPAILRREDEERWCDLDLKEAPKLLMEAYDVSTLVNSPRNDNPECIQRIA